MGAIRSFLGIPQVRWPVLFSVAARIPSSAVGIALPLLALSERMPPAIIAGTLVSCRSAQAVAGPLWGRFVDRYSLRLVLLSVGTAFGLTLALLAVLPLSSNGVVLLGFSVFAGALTVPMAAMTRSLWIRALPNESDRFAANEFESVLAEGVHLLGRVAVALTAIVLPLPFIVFGLGVMAVVGAIGLAMTELVRRDRSAATAPTRRLRDLVAGGPVFVTFFVFSASLGAFGTHLILRTGEHGSTATALVVAAWGLGSMLGMPVLRLGRIVAWRPLVGTAILTLLMALLQLVSLVTNTAGWMAVAIAAALAGLPISAVIAGLFRELGELDPPERRSEFHAWATTMLLAGDAAGSLLAGALMHGAAGPAMSVVIPLLAAVLAAVMMWIRSPMRVR